MKKLLILVIAFGVYFTAQAQEEQVKAAAKIEFEETMHMFGEIIQGDTVEHTFKFKNVGTAPVKILSARGSCGCTVPKYPREAIAAGGEGEIFVRFRSAGKSGRQNKTVTLITDIADQRQLVLTLRGFVKVEGSDD